MKVFKFGGASVKDAAGVKNLSSIVHQQHGQLIVVVSAMGKTTNLLETLCNAYFHQDPKATAIMKELKDFHLNKLTISLERSGLQALGRIIY